MALGEEARRSTRIGCMSAQFLRVAAVVAITACAADPKETVPSYREDIAPVLLTRCGSCHADGAGGFRVGNYVDAIGCLNGSTTDAMLVALSRPSHASVADTRALIARWVSAGSPAFSGGVHDPSFADPRSNNSHGRFLRARRWKPMLDATDGDACGRCHDAAPARIGAATAPGATACTSCHAEGPLGCTTCHGSRGFPPRDVCFFNDRVDAHAAHVSPSASTSVGISCARCHPTPTTGAPTGLHGDGYVSLTVAYTNGACAVGCHYDARPQWVSGAPVKCGGCHSIPPPAHYAGACSGCHREANADGTALIKPVLHMNGRVDHGDGSGKCGACHGTGDDPWPSSGAHAKHKTTMNAAPVACSTCHPAVGADHPRGGAPVVRLVGLAARGGRAPTYDAASKSCASTYCHDGAGGTNQTPKWSDKITCGACHSRPPPPPHSTSPDCATCHKSSDPLRHVNGSIEL